MREWARRHENGMRTVAVAAALLALIGIWSAFAGWIADRTPAPVPASADGIELGNGAAVNGDRGEFGLARRIIVYGSVTDDGEGDTAEG